jgi:hypothetical protein
MLSTALVVLLAAGLTSPAMNTTQPAEKSKEAAPPIVTPAAAQKDPTPAPSDAIVLFDGTNLDQWQHADGKPAQWTPEGKAGSFMTCKPGSGAIFTKQKFGSAQIHVEFATPDKIEGKGQERGNSGVYIQNRYEVQILDSYDNETYFNGQCGAVYLKHAPLANACRKPGEWQTYDIVFHAAKEENGKVVSPARVTVIHNGVLIQDNVEIDGPTGGGQPGTGDGPIHLQDHGNHVRYRNVWIRPLK